MIKIDDLITLWNKKVKGYHKTVRITRPYHEAKFQKQFQTALKDLPNIEDWEVIIDEVVSLMDDPWWQKRKGKHGLSWLFQRRNYGEGEFNYIHYYELAMDKKENAGEENEVYESLFGKQ